MQMHKTDVKMNMMTMIISTHLIVSYENNTTSPNLFAVTVSHIKTNEVFLQNCK